MIVIGTCRHPASPSWAGIVHTLDNEVTSDVCPHVIEKEPNTKVFPHWTEDYQINSVLYQLWANARAHDCRCVNRPLTGVSPPLPCVLRAELKLRSRVII